MPICVVVAVSRFQGTASSTDDMLMPMTDDFGGFGERRDLEKRFDSEAAESRLRQRISTLEHRIRDLEVIKQIGRDLAFHVPAEAARSVGKQYSAYLTQDLLDAREFVAALLKRLGEIIESTCSRFFTPCISRQWWLSDVP